MVIGGHIRAFLEFLDKFFKESLNIFLFEKCLERCDLIDSDICLKIDGGWFDFVCIYVISFLLKSPYVA